MLDTNVVSELTRPTPALQIVGWVDAQDPLGLAVTAMTAAKLLAGIALLPSGARRSALGTAVAQLLEVVFDGRVLPFNTAAAASYAGVVAGRQRAGTPIGAADAVIAAICLAHEVEALATRNTTDFTDTGLVLINPWDPAHP